MFFGGNQLNVMDVRPVMLVIGVLLSGLGAAMMLPMLADLIAGSKDWRAFATGGGLSMFLGGGLALSLIHI